MSAHRRRWLIVVGIVIVAMLATFAITRSAAPPVATTDQLAALRTETAARVAQAKVEADARAALAKSEADARTGAICIESQHRYDALKQVILYLTTPLVLPATTNPDLIASRKAVAEQRSLTRVYLLKMLDGRPIC